MHEKALYQAFPAIVPGPKPLPQHAPWDWKLDPARDSAGQKQLCDPSGEYEWNNLPKQFLLTQTWLWNLPKLHFKMSIFFSP